MIKCITRGVAVVWMVLVAGFAQASWEEAAQVVEGATKDLLTIMEDESLKEDARFDDLLGEMDRVLTPVVDFDYISKRVMGKYYRRANAEQRAQFSGVFKTTLLKTYAKALVGFKIESYRMVKPTKSSPDPKKQAISVAVKSTNGAEYTLVYYMLKRDGQWALVNASLDGINLRLTFKNQFANMAQEERGKVARVISVWQQKVDVSADKNS